MNTPIQTQDPTDGSMALMEGELSQALNQQPLYGLRFLRIISSHGEEKLMEFLLRNEDLRYQELLETMQLLRTQIRRIEEHGVVSSMFNQTLLENVIFLSRML